MPVKFKRKYLSDGNNIQNNMRRLASSLCVVRTHKYWARILLVERNSERQQQEQQNNNNNNENKQIK
jgi:cell division protein FtsL